MIEKRLLELGIDLPPPPKPLGRYVGAAVAGDLLFLSGMLPLSHGNLAFRGRLGANLSIDDGRWAANLAARNALAVARTNLGSLNSIRRVVRLGISLCTTDDFEQHASVADGASEFLAQIFGDMPGHTRLIVGARSLPLGTPIVLEIIFELRNPDTPHEKMER